MLKGDMKIVEALIDAACKNAVAEANKEGEAFHTKTKRLIGDLEDQRAEYTRLQKAFEALNVVHEERVRTLEARQEAINAKLDTVLAKMERLFKQ
jgi:hypothetical protein